jgi:hypothetical protein
VPNVRATFRPVGRTPSRWIPWIWSATAIYVAVGLLAFAQALTTGRFRWVEFWFRYPGAFLLAALAAIAVWFSLRVAAQFSPAEALGRTWLLIVLAATSDLFGIVCVHLLSMPLVTNLFDQRVSQASGSRALVQQIGVLASGTVRFALLATALFYVLRLYRQSDLLARLHPVDWLAIAVMGMYVWLEVRETILAMRTGMRPPLVMILGWPTDPLLFALLVQALFLFRSARQMRPGLVGKCWQAMAVGTLLVALGDFLLWAARSSYLPWPWSGTEWFVWMPAEAAFASAPIYQLQAVYAARTSRRRLDEVRS